MIGHTISKYRILEEVGSGSMGTVYKAQDTFLGRFAALKLLAGSCLQDRELVARFEREGMATTALTHPNICTVFESGRWQGRPFIAMEFLEGATLRQRLRGARLSAAEALDLALPITCALEAAHSRGIIHRDIKPANLFLTARGQVKVLDFGLARIQREFAAQPALGDSAPTVATFVTLPGTVLGTLAYMAPEQLRAEPVDARADLYSLGVVLYEALTGALPFRDAPLATLPGGLGSIVARLIRMDAGARYQSAPELREALARLKASA